MSTEPISPGTLKPPPRSALGLPAGSIRALLALLVTGMISLLIALPPHDPVRKIPPYLFYLLFIVVTHFFAAHGHSIRHVRGSPSPLYLPRGLVRLLILVGLAGSVTFAMIRDQPAFLAEMEATMQELTKPPYLLLPVYVLGGFFLGVIVRTLVGRDNPSPAIQDIEAWFALIAILLMCIAAFIKFVIETSLWEPLSWPEFEAIVAAVVAFYFGERS
jgi:hypothetical protein